MTAASVASSARSALHGRLAELLAFPTEGLAQRLGAGEVGAEVSALCGALPYDLPALALSGKQQAADFLGLQAAYIRHFEAAIGGKPCPLYAGVYSSSRRDAMEELLRFYRHFGLVVGGSTHDLPDSVPTVLEFLQVLAFEEEQPGADRDSLRAAQRDVLARHMCPWAAETQRRLAATAPEEGDGIYVAAIAFLARFAQAELAYVSGVG